MAQAKIQAPIDRPLSKAYLREFAGWSTNFPPGLSEPNSLRVMENVQVTREGAARVLRGVISLGTLTAFVNYSVQFFNPIRDIAGLKRRIQCSLPRRQSPRAATTRKQNAPAAKERNRRIRQDDRVITGA